MPRFGLSLLLWSCCNAKRVSDQVPADCEVSLPVDKTRQTKEETSALQGCEREVQVGFEGVPE